MEDKRSQIPIKVGVHARKQNDIHKFLMGRYRFNIFFFVLMESIPHHAV